MIKENQIVLNRVHILSDALMLVLSSAISYIIRFKLLSGDSGNAGIIHYIAFAVIISPFFIFIYSVLGMYESFRGKRFLSELSLLIKANIIGSAIVMISLFIFKAIHISRVAILIFFFISTLILATKKYLLRQTLKKHRSTGLNLKHVLLLGCGENAIKYINAIKNDKSLGFNIIGYVSQNNKLKDIKYLGVYDNIENIILNNNPDEIVVAIEAEEYSYIAKIITLSEKTGTKISIIPFFSNIMPAKPYIDEIDGLPLINIRRIPLDNIANAFLKRSMDIFGAIFAIILFSPIMIITAILIKISSNGSVIFKQERIGLDKKPFKMYKFRSMRENAKEKTAWSRDYDERKTKIGAFIRKFSIDELPQLYNILKGDMSLVGPRPEIEHFTIQFRETIPLYMVKHQVRPGLTGLAQINGFRGDTSIEERIKKDIYYIEHWTILLDIKILFQTIFKGFKNTEKIKN